MQNQQSLAYALGLPMACVRVVQTQDGLTGQTEDADWGQAHQACQEKQKQKRSSQASDHCLHPHE